MARKAVQGYPEKSYYDNTRYLGMVATTDPLNEGLFKHMVNFDVSDTGQSVQPRDGFITTTLKNGNTIISLSNKTIIFKNNDTNNYVIYDFKNNQGYLADVSAYNLQDNLLPIVQVITGFVWNERPYSFIYTLINQFSYARDYYNSLNTGNDSEKLTATLEHLRPFLNILPDSKIEHIYDENGVSKALIKAVLKVPQQTEFKFIIQMYYRKDAVVVNGVTAFAANTLTFEIVDLFNHPTFISTDRNIAVSKSIIPTVFQNLYTESKSVNANSVNPRPDGLVSTLGNFVYIYDEALQYVNNFIYRGFNYNIKPYFDLNPAYLDLNNVLNSTDKWSYKFELFNTSTEINDKNKEVVFSTPWMKYESPYKRPSQVFSTSASSRLNTISLGNTDPSLNHYQGAKTVIFVILKNTIDVTTSYINSGGQILDTFPAKLANASFVTPANTTLTYDNLRTIYENWLTILNSVNDLSSFRTAINTLSNNANFYIYNLNETPTVGPFKEFDLSMATENISTTKTSYRIVRDLEDDFDFLLNGTDLLKYVEDNNLFKNNYNIAFKLLPFSVKETQTVRNEGQTFTSDSRFQTQVPQYYPGNPSNVLVTPLNKRVQNTLTGIVYRQTSTPEGNTYVEVNVVSPAVDTPITDAFANNRLYKDTRTNSYYRWDNVTGFTGLLTATSNWEIEPDKLYWSFAAITNWYNSISYPTYSQYKTVVNRLLNNDFKYYKYTNGAYSLETDLNKLTSNENDTIIQFQSNANFDSGGIVRIPFYASATPSSLNLYANLDTYVQVIAPGTGTHGTIYRQTTSPYGNTWTSVFLTVSTPSITFLKGRLYQDTRTSKLYRWYNDTSITGTFTETEVDFNLSIPNFFDKGISGIFYIRPYEESELLNSEGNAKTFEELETLKVAWGATSLTQTFNVQYGYDPLTVTYIEKTLSKEPDQIKNSDHLVVFEDTVLLTWSNNVLYISETGKYYWFKDKNKIEFGEEIVKVLQYKTIILVFTTQHLYTVYRVETTATQLNPTTNQIEQLVTGVAWLKQIVLYNLLVSSEYADVIQVFNQMILFYSADGQLYMIRPNTVIDSETRFTLQFFNKAVNDVLINYPDYINERLAMYNKQVRITKNQVKIKALVSINFIKMFYYVPDVITYVLIYDVLNNRYYVYDTLTYTNIYDKCFIESGDLYITEQNGNIFFTVVYVEPNVRDNYTDMTITNNFKKEGINCLIDTGNLNLNNHLNKRFRDLHVVFKNLNSSNLLFNLETNIDEIIAKPFYSTDLEVKEINGISYIVPIVKENQNDLIELVDINQISESATDVIKYSLTNNLFENNNVLMDFSSYASSKLLTHRTSILGLGKVFRLKLQFISKGLYKLQNFGIIYKERRV
jgi:hypothetical protein